MSSGDWAELVVSSCVVCGNTEKLLRCAQCKVTWYCTKDHQKQDWKKHKPICKKLKISDSIEQNEYGHIVDEPDLKDNLPKEGSSENEFFSSLNEPIAPNNNYQELTPTDKSLYFVDIAMPISGMNVTSKQKSLQDFSEISLDQPSSLKDDEYLEEMCCSVIEDLIDYGVCVLDNFLGIEKCKKVLTEVLTMKNQGVFKDGQVAKGTREDSKAARSDQTCWVLGTEPNCQNIGYLIRKVDSIVTKANKMDKTGHLGRYNINARSMAMVACYPGLGTHYVKHVDNPDQNGRCITSIYYLNLNWDKESSGGLLRIHRENRLKKYTDVEPLFDRLIFFWSDNRNPHEVTPAFKPRYAITLWYYDAEEREKELRRSKEQVNY